MSDIINRVKDLLEKNNTRPSWDEYFMSIAFLAKSRSPCERLKVGCVLVKNNKIIGVGYNGFLPGAPHESMIKDGREQATIHAEINALANTTEKIEFGNFDTIAYITHSPCHNCVKSLLCNGVSTIIYNDLYREVSKESLELADNIHASIKKMEDL